MGRQSLPEGKRRRHQVNISLRDDELFRLEQRAEVARMSIVDYVRRRALSDRLKLMPPKMLAPEQFQQVARLANNVNQIARRLASGHVYSVPDGYDWELLELRRLLGDLMPEKKDR